MPYVGGYAHNDSVAFGARTRDRLANRILTGPQPARERLVHDNDWLRTGGIMRREVTASANWYAHRTEISVRRHPRKHGRVLAGRIRHAFRSDTPCSIAPERQRVGHAGPLDARDVAHTLQNIRDVGILELVGRVRRRRIDANGDGARRTEAKIDIEHADEAANEQPGADQQHGGEGYLCDD